MEVCIDERRGQEQPLRIEPLGGRPRDVFAQYMAKATGPTRGRDLNVHFGWLSDEGSMPSVISMLGDMVPVLVGALIAERMKPGAMQLTVMPRLATSCASALDMPMIPALEAA